jgi:hypothetical protein
LDQRVFGRHEYGFWFRAVVTAGLLGPFVYSAIFLFVGGELAFIGLFFLLLGVLGLPLIFRYNFFSLTVSRDEVRVESWRRKTVIALEDIVEIRTRSLGSWESASIRDRMGSKFSFEHDLRNYERIMKFLRERSVLGRRREDRAKAIGTHRYRRSALALWNLFLAWGIFVVLSIFLHNVSDSRIKVIALIFVGSVWLCVILWDLAFQLKIDDDGVQAKWLGSKKTILFTDIEKIEGGEWRVILTDSSKKKIGFGRILENYEHVREYLFRACQAGRVTPLEDLLE